jgi:uncharacterized repeat protein (TIGR03847 family)
MSESFDLASPDYFTTGAVGTPGQRVFYLQAREARQVVTLKVEKEQMSALADYVAGLLSKLPEPGRVDADLPLLEPIEPAWAVGSLGLGYDDASDRLVVVANEAVEQDEAEDADAGREEAEHEEDDGEESTETESGEGGEAAEGASARFLITRGQAAAFVERARALVRAGRPLCPMCQQPKDPEGHVCPRSNGHVVHRE